MSETIATTTPTSTPTAEQIKPVIDDIQADITLGLALVKAYKSNGLNGVSAQAPQVVAAAEKTYQDFVAELPAIKAGYKTTEFWLIAAVLIGNAAYSMVTGKTLPLDVNVLSGTLVSIYAAIRTISKSNGATK